MAIILSGTGLKINKSVTDLIFAPPVYDSEHINGFLSFYQDFDCEKYLYLPAFMSDREIFKIAQYAQNFDGFYIEGLYGLELCKKLKKKVFCGIETNVFNSIDNDYLKKADCKICLSKELSDRQINSLDGYVFALGAIKVMTFEYCPNGYNCRNCSLKEFNSLYDGENRCFTLRRYKTERCRFELYNSDMLSVKRPFNKMIFDFSGYQTERAQKILDCYFNGSFEKIRENFSYTNGNLIKGIN